MPEGKRHQRLCNALLEMLRRACGAESNAFGCDQFLYYDASTTKKKLAPDAFVKLGVPDFTFDSWLAWENGVPEIAFEVLSPSDSPERWTFEEKLKRYRAVGIPELIVIHTEGKPGERLRAWDRIEHDLVERIVENERTPCLALGLFAVVGPVGEDAVGLRIARDADGREPILSTAEALAAATQSRDDAQRDRDDALARIAELEQQLAERDRGGR
jgi:hypothetical protein